MTTAPDGPPQEPGRAPRAPGAAPPAAPPPAPPVFAVTGNARVDATLSSLDSALKPFRDAPPAENGAVGAVAQYVSGAVGLINAPAMFIDSAVSQGISAILSATGLSALFPALPVATVGTTMHIGTPHAHTHPPSLIPPAPPVPLPSMGIAFLAGSASVLVNGIPALRAGDIGLGITCGSLAPPFEITTGASGVYFAGARVARIGMDITRHCNPVEAAGGLATALGIAGIVGGALGAAGQAVAGNSTAAIAQAAQAALDAAAMGVKALCGKDPGIPPGIGVLLGPPTTVLAGGPPIPNVGAWAQGKIYGALGKLTNKVRGRFKKAAPDDNGKQCDAGEPVHVITGENYDTHVDFVSRHGGFTWARHLTSARAPEHGVIGWGGRHVFESRLEVRLHRVTFLGFDGARIEFPRLRRDEDVIRAKGYVLTRVSDRRYRVSHRRLGTLEFALDGAGRVHGRLVGLSNDRALVDLGHDDQRRLVEITEHARHDASSGERQPPARYELRYDREGHLSEVVELEGLSGLRTSMQTRRLAAYVYDAQGHLVVAEDVLGGRQRFVYDLHHRLVESTDRTGYCFRWSYDEQGRVRETQGEDGLWYSRLEYGRNKTFVTAHDGTVRTFHFGDDGVITKVEDGLGGFRERVQDESGRVIAEVDAAGQEVELLYDAGGAHVARRDRFGTLFPPELDDPRPPRRGRPSLPATHLHRTFGSTIDRLHESAVVSARLSAPPGLRGLEALAPAELSAFLASVGPARDEGAPVVERDPLGRVILERDAAHRDQSYRRDASGNVIAREDRDGRRYEQRITSWNLVGARVDPLGHKVSISYSRHERPTRITDAGGTVSELDYDGKDRLVRVGRHGRTRETYVYDEADRLLEKRDAEGELLLRVSPHDNGLPGELDVRGASPVRFDYDARGRVVEALTREHQVARDFDDAGHLRLDACDGRIVRHEHDARGQLRSIAVGRFVTRYARDASGVLTITDPSGAVRRVQTDRRGTVHLDHGNGSEELARHDLDGHLEHRVVWRRLRDGRLRTWSLVVRRTRAGDVRAIHDSARGQRLFTIDEAHRLVREETERGTTDHYTHDAAGNLVELPGVDGVELREGNRLLRAGGEHFVYDLRDHVRERSAAGRRVRYVRDGLDQLVRIEDGEAPFVASYDGLGRRVLAGRGRSLRRAWWSGDRIAAESEPDGRLRIYVYADATSLVPLGFVDYASESAPPESGRSYAVIGDQTGMPLQIEDSAGRLVWWATRVSPYGVVDVRDADPRHGPPLVYRMRWPGHVHDEETGLHYNRFRYYDPRIARYLESDPIGCAGGVNLYAYPSNPLVSVDLQGLHNEQNKPAGDESESRPLTESADTTQNVAPPKNIPKDLVPDSNGVYGYVPTEDSQFHTSKGWPDWTDPDEVSAARTRRLEYHEGLEHKRQEIQSMRDSGMGEEDIARVIVEKRNADRIDSYVSNDDQAGLERLYQRNLEEYGRKEGPTFEQLRDEQGKTATQMIESSTKSNRTMDILTGIVEP